VPKGWTQVAYIESHGSEYIDLGYKGGEDSKVEIGFSYHSSSSATGNGRLFGSRISSTNAAFAVGTSSGVVGATGNKMFWCYDAQAFYVIDSAFDLDTWHEIVFSATEHSYDGDSYGDDYTPTTFETPSNLALFGFENNGTFGYGIVRVSRCKLWSGATLLRDLLPVYDGTEYAMYDIVSDTILHNAGTGSFTGGSAVAPSPGNPMDIWCNNGVLRYSANMANVNADTALVGYYISAQGVVSGSEYNWMYQDYIPVKPSTVYTLSMSTPVYFVSVSEYSTAEDSGFVVRKTGSSGSNTSLTFTTEVNTNFIRFGSNLHQNIAITLEEVLAINWMLNLGGTAMDYQPYVEGGIYADGTPEVLTVDCNEFDVATMGTPVGATLVRADSNGVEYNGTSACFVFPCAPNTTYTISLRSMPSSGSIFRIATTSQLVSSDNTPVAAIAYDLDNTNFSPKTINSGAGAAYMYIQFSIASITEVANLLVIQKGTSVIQPQTITNIPNELSCGDYADSYEFVSGLLTHKVGVKVLNGTEDIGKSTIYRGSFFVRNIVRDLGTFNNAPLLCTRLASVTSDADYAAGKCMILNNALNLWLWNDNTHEIADARNELATAYASGSPYIVLYPLATETTGQGTAYPQLCNKMYSAADVTAEVSGISVTFTTGTQTVPNPYSQLPIMCNNGELKWNGTAVVTDGTPETITITGLNLIPEDQDWYSIYGKISSTFSNGVWTITNTHSTGRSAKLNIGVIPAGTYYIGIASSSTSSSFTISKTDESWWQNFTPGNRPIQFTLTEDTEMYVSKAVDVGDTTVTGLMLSANEALPYSPYVTPQTVTDIPNLLAVGNYKDTHELISGLQTHKIGVKVLDGTEDWMGVSTPSINRAVGLVSDVSTSDGSICASTHFVGVTRGTSGASMPDNSIRAGYGIGAQKGDLYIKSTAYPTVETLTAFLADQYAAGTPVIVLYPLATATTEQGTKYPALANAKYNTATVSAEVAATAAITTGTTTTPSPYAPISYKCNNGTVTWDSVNQRVEAVGTPEVLTVIGKNLFDSTPYKTGYYIDANGVEQPATNYVNEYFIRQGKVMPSTQYTVSFKAIYGGYTQRFHAYMADGTWISQVAVVDSSGTDPYKSVTFTTPANCAYIRQGGRSQSNYQLEQGNTPTAYEPYTAQTASVADLFAVGDYKDIVELIEGIRTGKVGVKVLDGTEPWTQYGVGKFATPLIGSKKQDNQQAPISTHFIGVSYNNVPNTDGRVSVFNASISQTSGGLGINHQATPDVTTFKAFLAAQYAAGNPVIIVYPLATETTEQGTPQPLTQTIGYNFVSISANVSPIEKKIIYYTE